MEGSMPPCPSPSSTPLITLLMMENKVKFRINGLQTTSINLNIWIILLFFYFLISSHIGAACIKVSKEPHSILTWLHATQIQRNSCTHMFYTQTKVHSNYMINILFLLVRIEGRQVPTYSWLTKFSVNPLNVLEEMRLIE